MSLQDPTRKMSKSDPNPKGTVYLTDEPGVIMKKVPFCGDRQRDECTLR